MKKLSLFVQIILLTACIVTSCKSGNSKEISEKLKNTMDLYLNHQPSLDTSWVKFKTLEVRYAEEKDRYRCDFKVNMREKMEDHIKDTTGTMSVYISKDFNTVTRRK